MTTRPAAVGTSLAGSVLIAVAFAHFLNDLIQSLVVATYPLFRENFALSFAQLGFITLTYQVTASVLQPLVGSFTDRRPLPYSLCFGMTCTLVGLGLLASAGSFAVLLVAAALVGVGSSVFHPEASRVARLASGGRYGFAQSVFQVGGNAGSALGPLAAVAIVMSRGQQALGWFTLVALLAIGVLFLVGNWYRRHLADVHTRAISAIAAPPALPRALVVRAFVVLLILLFSKYVYIASLTNFYVFYLMQRFQVSAASAQIHLFIFLAAVAAGTVIGGPVGDRFGRRRVIWGSILGVAPFTLLLPHVDLAWTTALSVIIGFVLASAFSAILVYAQELLPGRVGLVSGLFFGLAFGIAGIAAAVLGAAADRIGLEAVYQACAFLPLLGVLTILLPEVNRRTP